MVEARPSPIVRAVAPLVAVLEVVSRNQVDASLATLEQAVMEAVRGVLPALLQAVVMTSQRSLWPGGIARHWACPHCAGRSRVQSWRFRTVTTVCGVLRLERPWCVCSQCGQGFSPTDRSLALAARTRLSVGIQAWVVELGASTSFPRATALLSRLTGVAVSAETVRQQTEGHGHTLEGRQQAAAAQVLQTREAASAVDPAPGQLVVETDGVMVRYLDGWHEVKVGLVGGYVAGKLTKMSYTAARAAPEQFGPRLLAEAARRGALEIVGWEGSPLQPRLAVLREVAVLGDGAPWIWNLAAEHFGKRVEIVDFYHASEHIWTAAKARFGDIPEAATWANARVAALRTQGAAPVQAALAEARAPTAEAEEVLRRERGYFRTNAARMAYPTFQAAGLPLGSGAVESSARHVVQQRLKRAGCRWSAVGASGVLNVCCALASSAEAA